MKAVAKHRQGIDNQQPRRSATGFAGLPGSFCAGRGEQNDQPDHTVLFGPLSAVRPGQIFPGRNLPAADLGDQGIQGQGRSVFSVTSCT